MNKNFKFFVVFIGVVIIALIFYDQFANEKLIGINPTTNPIKTSVQKDLNIETFGANSTNLNSTKIKEHPGYLAYIEGNDLTNTSPDSNKSNTLYFQKLSIDYPNYLKPKEITLKKDKNNAILYSAIELTNSKEALPSLKVVFANKSYKDSNGLKSLYTDFLNLKINETNSDATLEKTKNSVLYMDLSSKDYFFKKVIETKDGTYYISYNGLNTDHNINDILNSISLS